MNTFQRVNHFFRANRKNALVQVATNRRFAVAAIILTVYLLTAVSFVPADQDSIIFHDHIRSATVPPASFVEKKKVVSQEYDESRPRIVREDKGQNKKKEEEKKDVNRADPGSMKLIKGMFEHAWRNYERYAWGFDELKPVSKSHHSWMGGHRDLAATIIDSLDTLYIMGMKSDFEKAVKYLNESVTFNVDADVSTFETTIRILGGLVAAFDLSGDRRLLTKAVEIGDRLMPAFNTPSGIPNSVVNLATGRSYLTGWMGGRVSLAEVGTLQMEFSRLSDLTGELSYKKTAMKAFDALFQMKTKVDGLWPMYIYPDAQYQTNDEFSFGAMADSFYEYLLKVWVMDGQEDNKLRNIYDKAVNSSFKHNYGSTNEGFGYISTYWADRNRLDSKMEHLTCFTGGMYALGSRTLKNDLSEKAFEVAEKVTETCYQMYRKQPLGISPENVDMNYLRNTGGPYYILRPEALESIFYMWRFTHDQKYRDWGLEIAKNINTHCRVNGGFSGLRSVYEEHFFDDVQQSFFLAETLKYLYLLFADDSLIPLDQYVFNTEAHPFKIKK